MKYALLSLKKHVLGVYDKVNSNTMEITDEQATQVTALRNLKRMPILFEGAITDEQGEREAKNRFRWNEELGDWVRTPILPPVPKSISAWQAAAALKLTPYGPGTLHDAVVTALNGLPDGPEKIVAITAFEKDAQFDRASPTITAIAQALKLESQQIDNLFRLGASLTV